MGFCTDLAPVPEPDTVLETFARLRRARRTVGHFRFLTACPRLLAMGSGAAPALTDQLVARLAHRDEAAIHAAYESLADPLFRFLRSRCGQDELAGDIVGETFIELIRSAPRLEGGVEGLRRWLFTAALHNLLDELRKRQRRGEDVAADAASAGGGRDLGRWVGGQRAPRSPEEHVVDGERDAEVRRALIGLPDAQREVLELRFAGELPAAQAGEVMGRSPGGRCASSSIGR